MSNSLVFIYTHDMDNNSNNIMIISYNRQSLVRDKNGTLHGILNECDILFLQAVWKCDNESINIVKREFQGIECAYTSNMSENESLIGRKYVVVGILYRANAKCSIDKIDSISKRICA